MKKLDDIPKKRPFDAPGGYFDSLPGRIQARIEDGSPRPVPLFGHVQRYALALLIVAAIAFVWLTARPGSNHAQSPEAILATLDTPDLVAYLQETDMTTEELLDAARLDTEDAEEIEGSVFSLDLDTETLDNIVSEMN